MKLLIAAAICAISSSVFAQQNPAPPVLPLSADEQQLVDAQFAPAKLNSGATVASVELRATPLRQILDAIATAAGITIRYDSGIASLDSPADASLSKVDADVALRRTLEPQKLTFKVTGAKSVFVFADTPANREKFTEAIRVFAIANADMMTVTTALNRAMGKPEGLRPAFVTLAESRKLVVKATPDKMAEIAKVIAANDKKQELSP